MTGPIGQDHMWFTEHPGREYRVRDATEEELSQLGLAPAMDGYPMRAIVHLLCPGVCIRHFAYLSPTLPDTDELLAPALSLFRTASDQEFDGLLTAEDLRAMFGGPVTKH